MRDRLPIDKRRLRAGAALAATAAVASTTTACALLIGACAVRTEIETPDPPLVVPSEPIDWAGVRATVDLDSLSADFAARADAVPVAELPALEAEVRDWLARLEFEDPALLPLGEPAPRRWFRRYRGQLLDSLGWSAFRRGDLRQAEAALSTAVEEINSRGTTAGYARHFFHLGEVHAARGRWAQAAEAYLDAEIRGLGDEATPALEHAWRRRHGSLRGLDGARDRELARVEDERRQRLVEGSERTPLPSFTWPRRTGRPLTSGELLGRPLVVAVWDERCAGCAGYGQALEPLAAALDGRGASLVGVWLGADPTAAGPPRPYPLLLPPDPERARGWLGASLAPVLLVVDARGRIRYRHAGRAALPPPVADIVVQIDHLRRAP